MRQRESGQEHRRGSVFGDRDIDPAALRARLSRELERVRAHETRLAAALAALDEGKNPDEVVRAVLQGEPGRERDPGQNREITPEERERAMAMLEKHAPEMGERMRRALEQNPQMGGRMLERIIGMQREIAQLSRWNPELAQIKREEAKTGFELRAAGERVRETGRNKEEDPEAFEAASSDLRRLFGRQFDLDTRAKQNEIDGLSGRVQELQEQLNARENERESLINERMERMLESRPDRRRRRAPQQD